VREREGARGVRENEAASREARKAAEAQLLDPRVVSIRSQLIVALRDPNALADLAIELDEATRVASAEGALALHRAENQYFSRELNRAQTQIESILFAGFCRGTRDELHSIHEWDFGLIEMVHPRMAEVFSARPPAVQQRLADKWGRFERWTTTWPLLRALERAGLVEERDDDEYWVQAWRALVPDDNSAVDKLFQAVRNERVARDPALAARMAASIARPACGPVFTSFFKADVLDAVVDLERAGVFERVTVVEAILDALAAAPRPGVAASLRRLLDAVAPEASELAPHGRKIVQVVAHGRPSEQAAGAGWLVAAASAGGEVDSANADRALCLAAEQATKAGARELLRAAETVLGPRGLTSVARAALANPNADIQLMAVDVLARGLGDDLANQQALADAVAEAEPRVRERIVAALASASVVVTGARGSGAPARPTLADSALTMARPLPVVPLATADDLIDSLTMLVAGSLPGGEIDRIVDGLCRFSASDASAGHRGLLLKRLRSFKFSEVAWERPTTVACLLEVTTWLARAPDVSGPIFREQVPENAFGRDVTQFLRARFAEAVAVSGDRPGPSLSLPEDTRGGLCIATVVARLGERRGDVGTAEMHDTAARLGAEAALEQLPGKAGTRIRDLARSGVPHIEDWKFDDAPPPARSLRRGVRVTLDSPKARATGGASDLVRAVAARFASLPGGEGYRTYLDFFGAGVSRGKEELAWSLVAMPQARDLILGYVAGTLYGENTSQTRDRCEELAVESLTWPSTGTGPGADCLIAMGMMASVAGARAATLDVLPVLAATGRLRQVAVGTIVGRAASSGVTGLARAAAAVAEYANVDGQAASAAQIAEHAMLVVRRDHRELGALLEAWELALDLAAARVDSPDARSHLEQSGAGSSKRAQAARRLLAL